MTEDRRVPRILQPDGWTRPKGYSHGMAARGLQIFISGQIGWDADGNFHSMRLADQVRQRIEMRHRLDAAVATICSINLRRFLKQKEDQ